MSGDLVDVLCSDCDGGAERCAREGHLQLEAFELESIDPTVATFVCPRCNVNFMIPRCASCGRIIGKDGCAHPSSKDGCAHPSSK